MVRWLCVIPAARSRVADFAAFEEKPDRIIKIEFVTVYENADGKRFEVPLNDAIAQGAGSGLGDGEMFPRRIYLDGNL